MTEQQFQQLLRNQQRREPRPALDSTLASELVAAAASARRRRAVAQGALERLAAPEWCDRADVYAVEDGIVTVSVDDWALCMQLRASRFPRDLMRAVSGVRSVRIAVRGFESQETTEQHE